MVSVVAYYAADPRRCAVSDPAALGRPRLHRLDRPPDPRRGRPSTPTRSPSSRWRPTPTTRCWSSRPRPSVSGPSHSPTWPPHNERGQRYLTPRWAEGPTQSRPSRRSPRPTWSSTPWSAQLACVRPWRRSPRARYSRLANKESLVVGGSLVTSLASSDQLIPVDSRALGHLPVPCR